MIIKSILNFVKIMKYPFTAHYVSCFLYKKFRVKIPSLLIWIVLKGLWLSYKLGKSHPLDHNEEKWLLMKDLFNLKAGKLIANYNFLVNIDETMFSRTTKANRILSNTGIKKNLMNICVSNSTSLMAAIISFGDVLSVEIQGGVKANIL